MSNDVTKYNKETNEIKDIEKYQKEYSEHKLLNKIKKFGKVMGADLVYLVLILYNVIKDPTIPFKFKAPIIGTLGYVILPFDLIWDHTPFVGYTDDFAAAGAALKIVVTFITPEMKKKAKDKTKAIFGNDIEKELERIDNMIIEPFKRFGNKADKDTEIIDVDIVEVEENK